MVSFSEQLETLAFIDLHEAAAIYRRKYWCVWGWYRNGIDTPSGRVRLQVKRVGGAILTTREWLEAFLQACDQKNGRPTAETPAAATARGRRGQKRAEKELSSK